MINSGRLQFRNEWNETVMYSSRPTNRLKHTKHQLMQCCSSFDQLSTSTSTKDYYVSETKPLNLSTPYICSFQLNKIVNCINIQFICELLRYFFHMMHANLHFIYSLHPTTRRWKSANNNNTNNRTLWYNMNKKAQLTQREARDSLGI